RGTDPRGPGVARRARELRVRGEEAVAGVDRLGAGLLRRVEDLVDGEIRLGRETAAEGDGDVRPPRVERLRVDVGTDRDALDAHLARGADDAERDLTAVGDQDAAEHRGAED